MIALEPVAHLFPLPKEIAPQDLSANPLSNTRQSAAPVSLPAPNPSNDEQPTLPSAPATPGRRYSIYASQDILGTLPRSYELVLDIAARWVGVGREDVGTVVERFEKRAGAWWKKEKRNRRDQGRRQQERSGNEHVGEESEGNVDWDDTAGVS